VVEAAKPAPAPAAPKPVVEAAKPAPPPAAPKPVVEAPKPAAPAPAPVVKAAEPKKAVAPAPKPAAPATATAEASSGSIGPKEAALGLGGLAALAAVGSLGGGDSESTPTPPARSIGSTPPAATGERQSAEDWIAAWKKQVGKQ